MLLDADAALYFFDSDALRFCRHDDADVVC